MYSISIIGGVRVRYITPKYLRNNAIQSDTTTKIMELFQYHLSKGIFLRFIHFYIIT